MLLAGGYEQALLPAQLNYDRGTAVVLDDNVSNRREPGLAAATRQRLLAADLVFLQMRVGVDDGAEVLAGRKVQLTGLRMECVDEPN